MGGMCILECTDCGYSKKYYTGSGMFYLETKFEKELKRKRKVKTVYEQIVSGYFGEEAKDVFLEHISERIFCYDNREGGKTPYYCAKCEKIKLRYPLTFTWYDEEEDKRMGYEIKYYCSICESELIKPGVFNETIECKCPKCGRRNAILMETGLLWD